jgi:hypothetical protein
VFVPCSSRSEWRKFFQDGNTSFDFSGRNPGQAYNEKKVTLLVRFFLYIYGARFIHSDLLHLNNSERSPMNIPTNTPSPLKCPQCGANLTPGPEEYLVCQYCGSSLIWQRQLRDAGSQTGQEGTEQAVRGMRLKPYSVTDSEVTGMDIFRMLIPEGWQTRSACRWLLDNPGMPAVVSFQVWNPRGGEAFEILPNMNFTWNNSPLTHVLKPQGSRYFGAEVQPPVRIAEAFSCYVLPRYRSRLGNLQVLQMTPQPDLPRLVKSEAVTTPGATADGTKVRFCYSLQGYSFEEEMYGVVEVFRVPIQSMLGSVELAVWFVDFLFSFRAQTGRLDATADLFSVMLQSFRLNPNWSAAVKTVSQQLIRMQIDQIQHIGQIGEILASAGSQMRDQNLNDWYARQDVYDRLAVDRSRAIRGVDGFYDPTAKKWWSCLRVTGMPGPTTWASTS